MDVGGWLRGLGLEQYEAAFRENAIDEMVLPNLTAEDLKELGVGLVGHRRKLLDAIGALRADANAPSPDALAESDRPPKESVERRQVTVMFSDLVGSTALSARMDPEDLREVVAAYHRCASESVRRVGGFVSQYLGDGVLAYFGYPLAHEDDAERAVRAGLDLIAAVAVLKTRIALHTRVGIATGLVVVGDVVDAGGLQERGIVGETPNLAARLQGIAQPNTVVIAESTRRLLGNLFELQDLGPRELKGSSGPVRAWAALHARSVESRFEALRASGLSRLVGQQEECDLLLRRWSRAKASDGQVVLLSGEAGIGKSRLTATLLEHLADEPHTRLRYFCSPQHTDSALYPIIGQLERSAGLAHDDSPQTRLDKLNAALAQTSTSPRDAALFSEMLSLPNDGRYPSLDPTPEQRRQRTLDALITQLESLSGQNPVLMIFEDAHWVDPTSLEALGRVVNRIRSLRVLLIVTFRPEFEPPWMGQPHVTALTINRLTQREIGLLIDSLVGNKMLPATIRHDIIERTDGIPLFIEEMTKAVLEAENDDEARQTAATVPSPAQAVPASLHASLMARLDRLGPAKDVAQVGAVIGREFSHALLVAVLGMPQKDLGSALDRLTTAGLLFRQGMPPYATYLFKHALVQDAAYGTLLREARRVLHARIAEVLEGQFTEIAASQPELLAYHLTECGRLEEAVEAWEHAGDRAIGRSALVEGISHFRRSLETLKRLPHSSAHDRKELGILLKLGGPLTATHGYAAPEILANYTRARALCEETAQAGAHFHVLEGLWVYHYVSANLLTARDVGNKLLAIATSASQAPQLLRAHTAMGCTTFGLGECTTAREHFERALTFHDPERDIRLMTAMGADPGIPSLVYLGWILTALGYPDQGFAAAQRAFTLGEVQPHSFSRAWGLQAMALAYLSRGMMSEALGTADALITLSREQRFATWFAHGMLLRAAALSWLDSPAKAIPMLKEAIAARVATGNLISHAGVSSQLVGAYLRSGDFAAGLALVTELLAWVERTGNRQTEPRLWLLRGQLLLATNGNGDAKEAEVSMQKALTVSRQQQAKLTELATATPLAQLWRREGRASAALELLQPIYAWFTEGFEFPVLREAQALLGELRSQ
jgi:class 3 adenylate cyclase/tetratricopeptide (TPR) repeat protein